MVRDKDLAALDRRSFPPLCHGVSRCDYVFCTVELLGRFEDSARQSLEDQRTPVTSLACGVGGLLPYCASEGKACMFLLLYCEGLPNCQYVSGLQILLRGVGGGVDPLLRGVRDPTPSRPSGFFSWPLSHASSSSLAPSPYGSLRGPAALTVSPFSPSSPHAWP